MSVGVQVKILSVTDISDSSMDFTVTMDFIQVWNDPRLNETTSDETAGGEFRAGPELAQSFWIPDSAFPNVKHVNHPQPSTFSDMVLTIQSSGTISLSRRMSVTASCEMDLHDFPLDCQKCSLEIQSFGHSVQDVEHKWRSGDNSDEDRSLFSTSSFLVTGVRHQERMVELLSGNYSRLSLVFDLDRNLGHYLKCLYCPAIMCIILSWVSFLLPPRYITARVLIGVASLLAVLLLEIKTSSLTAKTSYLTASDIYLWWCGVTVLGSLAVTVWVACLEHRKGGENKLEVVDGTCSGIFRD